ncbi:hypothetical protein DFJ74DRAFT_674987 [Hyaloraphidium curvatum]|nr:hypothetical protein DFJ74DRAFT_674987 [Hyaloraphidium curvatum]
MGLLFVVALLLRMGERLRITAAAAGIDPTELASHPPLTSETDAESEYRLLAATSDAAVSSILSSFPEPAGTAVTSGDPAPLLVPSLGYFDTPHEACCFLSLFLGCLGAGIRSWFSAPPGSYHARNPGTPFFASPQFLAALECATVGTGIMRCLLAADPGLLYCWTSASIPALAIGGLQAAALRTCLAAGGRKSAAEFGGLEGWVEDVEVAAGFVEAMAALGVEALSGIAARPRTSFDSLTGVFAGPIARSFRTMIEDTKRLVVADEGPEGGAFPSFAETVLLGEAWIATVLRTRNGRTGSG